MDQEAAHKAYEEYLERAKNDPRIKGAILSGGRGKGMFTINSDYDLMLITSDEDFESVKADYPKTDYVDSLPYAISEFREHARIGTETAYDKYNFAHVKVLFDKFGELQKLVDEKGSLSVTEAEQYKRDSLNGYLNSFYRAMKNTRDGNALAARLDAAETIPNILAFVFAVENRVRPFNKFVAWELKNYPLTKLSVDSKEFLQLIESILQDGDVEAQKQMLILIRNSAAENNCQDILDSWEGYYFGESHD